MRNGEYMRKILMPAARVFATILLIVSLAMFGILVRIALGLASGQEVQPRTWMFPLVILATGAALMSFLRKPVSMQVYVLALALWLLTTGYYVAVAL
jgi:hypothetical protein